MFVLPAGSWLLPLGEGVGSVVVGFLTTLLHDMGAGRAGATGLVGAGVAVGIPPVRGGVGLERMLVGTNSGTVGRRVLFTGTDSLTLTGATTKGDSVDIHTHTGKEEGR